MHFENFFYIYFLPLAVVPLIIYLIFRKKPKKIIFSSLFLLRSITKSVNRKTRLKDIILLIIRTAIAALIVLMFAGPFFGKRQGYESSGRNAVFIYIDTSPSMAAGDQKGSYLDKAKTALVRTLDILSENDKVFINTTDPDFNFKGTRSDALKIIGDIGFFGRERSFVSVLKNQDSLFSEMKDINKLFIAFTDANLECGTEIPEADGYSRTAVLFDTADSEEDASIDTLFFSGSGILNASLSVPDGYETVFDVFKNGAKIYSENIKGDKNPVRSITLDTASKRYSEDLFTASIGDDGNNSNNIYRIVLPMAEKRRVLVAGEERSPAGRKIAALLNSGKDSLFLISFINPALINSVRLEDYTLMIFAVPPEVNSFTAGEIKKFVSNGGGVYFTAGSKLNLNSYNSNLIPVLGMPEVYGLDKRSGSYSQIAIKERDHTVFEDVFLDGQKGLSSVEVYGHFRFSAKGWNVIAETGGYPILMEKTLGRGKIILLSTGLEGDESNILDNGIAIPFVYNALLYMADGTVSGSDMLTVGDRLKPGRRSYLTVHGKIPEPGTDELSETFVLKREGFYSIFESDGKLLRTVGVNNEREKRVSCRDFLEKRFTGTVIFDENTDILSEILRGGGRDMTVKLIIAISLLIAAEILIVRFF
jgi:hypothetical protein